MKMPECEQDMYATVIFWFGCMQPSICLQSQLSAPIMRLLERQSMGHSELQIRADAAAHDDQHRADSSAEGLTGGGGGGGGGGLDDTAEDVLGADGELDAGLVKNGDGGLKLAAGLANCVGGLNPAVVRAGGGGGGLDANTELLGWEKAWVKLGLGLRGGTLHAQHHTGLYVRV